MSRLTRATTVLLLLATLVGSAAAPVAAGPAAGPIEDAKRWVQQLTQQKEQTQQERDEKEAKLKQLEQQEQSAADALQRVEGELYAAIERLEAIETKLDKIEVHIRDLEAQQEEHRAMLFQRSAAYGERLRAIYKLTQTPPLVLILGATDIHDFLKRLNLFSAVAREDSRLAAAVQREQEKAESVRQELDEEKARATALRAEATEVKLTLDNKRALQQQLIAQIEAEEARTQQEITDMDRQAQSLTGQIQHWNEVEIPRLEEIQRLEEERRRREAEAASQAASQAASRVAPPSGPFMWPVSGILTARYGQRTFAQRFHTGVDIAANLRVPIRAAATGFVRYVGYAVQGNRGASYGMYVILQHGDGRVTLYAHLDDRVSPPQVNEGQVIERGTIVGVIGMTGITSGPHLHFEVRERDGATRNPLEFLPT